MASPEVLYQAGVHASRPANGAGCVLYSCTDHDLVYRDDGTTWTTFMTLTGGAVATDAIWDAAGDLVQGTGANTAAKLSAGTAAMFLKSAGAAAANLWAFPPGHRFDYVQRTTDLSVTGTTEGTATTWVTGASITYDGSTAIRIRVQAIAFQHNSGGGDIRVIVRDDTAGTVVACVAYATVAAGIGTMNGECFVTPTAAARVYSVRAYVDAGTGTIYSATGSIPSAVPGFMEITKV